MIFYGDSFNTNNENDVHPDLKSTIKMEYNLDYDKEVFYKIYNLFKNDKNVKIEILNIEENKK